MWNRPLINAVFSIVAASFGLLDDAEQRAVARLVAADAAQIALGHVAALPAEGDAILRLHDRGGEALGVGRVGLHEPEREPLRRLRSHTGKPRELVDELLDRTFVHRLLHPLGVGRDLGAEHLLHALERLGLVDDLVVLDDLHRWPERPPSRTSRTTHTMSGLMPNMSPSTARSSAFFPSTF